MIHVLNHRDPDVSPRLLALVDRAKKVLLVCTAHAEPGGDVAARQPLQAFDAYAGDLVDTVVLVDEGQAEGMWRDPIGDLCARVFPNRSEASEAAIGYLFLRGRRALAVVRKSLWDPDDDLRRLSEVVQELDPDRTPRLPPKAARAPPAPDAAAEIPAVEEAPADDPFALLGLTRAATLEEARSAWRGLMAQYHPDKVAHLAREFQDLAERRTRELNAAFEAVERRLAGSG